MPPSPAVEHDKLAEIAKGAVCFTAAIGGRKISLLPIARLPKSHPAVARQHCGTKLTPDDPIPVKSIARFNLGKKYNRCMFGSTKVKGKLKKSKECKQQMKKKDCPNKKLREGTKYYEQSAPQLFYAYGYPKKDTGNPGFYGADAASIYPIVDAKQSVYFVMTLDVHALPPSPVSPPRVMPSLTMSSCPCHLLMSCRRSQKRPRVVRRPPPNWRWR